VKPAVDWYASSAVARILPEQQLQLWKGTPVVAGKAGGIPLQIQNGSGGYLVESVEECAERTLSLLRDRTRADAIASAGRETVPQALSAHQIDCRRTAASRIAAWRWSPSINSDGSDRVCWGNRCPVCGMTVDTSIAVALQVQGRTHYFCAAGCKEIFEQNPGRFERLESRGGFSGKLT
jgi:trehalose synthase